MAGTVRKVYAEKTKFLNPTDDERDSYRALQHALGMRRYLIYYSPLRELFADIDASKKTGMSGMDISL